MELTKAEVRILKASSQARKMSMGWMIFVSIMIIIGTGTLILDAALAHSGSEALDQITFAVLLGLFVMTHIIHAHSRSTALVLIHKLQRVESEG